MSLQDLDYKAQQDQVAEAQIANATLLLNTKLTKWTLYFAVIGTLGTLISAIADVLRIYK